MALVLVVIGFVLIATGQVGLGLVLWLVGVFLALEDGDGRRY